MHQENPPAKVASNAVLGQTPERAAFEAWFLKRYSYTRIVLTNPIWAREVTDAEEVFSAGQTAERERWSGVEAFLSATLDGSLSRNSSDSLAAQLLEQIQRPNASLSGLL